MYCHVGTNSGGRGLLRPLVERMDESALRSDGSEVGNPMQEEGYTFHEERAIMKNDAANGTKEAQHE